MRKLGRKLCAREERKSIEFEKNTMIYYTQRSSPTVCYRSIDTGEMPLFTMFFSIKKIMRFGIFDAGQNQ